MNIGYIALHRKILDWEWYKNTNVVRVFFHLLIKANFEKKKWMGIEIMRGSFITSYANLSFETGLSIQQVRTAINKLKSTSEITSIATTEYTVITVVNYDEYQNTNKHRNKRATNEQQTSNKRATTTNKDNKDNKDNKEREHTLDTLIDKKHWKPKPYAPQAVRRIDDGLHHVPNKDTHIKDTHIRERESTLTVAPLKRNNIGKETFESIADRYEVPTDFVEDCWDSAQNWLDANAKVKKDYKAFLSNWVKRERASYILNAKKLQTRRGGVFDARTK